MEFCWWYYGIKCWFYVGDLSMDDNQRWANNSVFQYYLNTWDWRLDEAFYNEMKKKENLFCKILFYRLQSKNIILWKIQTLQIWAADRLGSCFLLIPASPDLNVAWILSLIIFFFVTRSFFFFAKANTRCY